MDMMKNTRMNARCKIFKKVLDNENQLDYSGIIKSPLAIVKDTEEKTK